MTISSLIMIALLGGASSAALRGSPTGANSPWPKTAHKHASTTTTMRRFDIGDAASCGEFINSPTNTSGGCRTHELTFVAPNSVFVSQSMRSKVLHFKLGEDGSMGSDWTEYTIGTIGDKSWLHGLRASDLHPGKLWMTTQADGYVWLTDPQKDLAVIHKLQAPLTLGSGYVPISEQGIDDATVKKEGLVLTQKAKAMLDKHQGSGPQRFRLATEFAETLEQEVRPNSTIGWPHSICEIGDGRIAVNLQNAPGECPECRTKDTYAVWVINPKDYNTSAPDGGHGGVVYQALAKPVNCAVDGVGRVIVGQDTSNYVMSIDSKTGKAVQIRIGDATKTPTAGPGVVAAPDGSVWVASIETSGYVNRFHPGSDIPVVVDITPVFGNLTRDMTDEMIRNAVGGMEGDSDSAAEVEKFDKMRQLMVGNRVIHFAFSENPNRMYALTGALHSPTQHAPEAIVEITFDDEWKSFDPSQSVVTPLGDNTYAHRIVSIPHKSGLSHAVTMWATDQLVHVTKK